MKELWNENSPPVFCEPQREALLARWRDGWTEGRDGLCTLLNAQINIKGFLDKIQDNEALIVLVREALERYMEYFYLQYEAGLDDSLQDIAELRTSEYTLELLSKIEKHSLPGGKSSEAFLGSIIGQACWAFNVVFSDGMEAGVPGHFRTLARQAQDTGEDISK